VLRATFKTVDACSFIQLLKPHRGIGLTLHSALNNAKSVIYSNIESLQTIRW